MTTRTTGELKLKTSRINNIKAYQYIYMYSMPQKHCTKFSNEKSSVFFPVNLLKKLHASTCGIYNYIYKIKKNAPSSTRPPAAARRGRSERQSRALQLRSIERRKRSSSFFPSFVYNSTVRAVVAATRGARMLIIQGCHLGHFFNFIYVIIKAIGTCMQTFKKIDRKKNRTCFI